MKNKTNTLAQPEESKIDFDTMSLVQINLMTREGYGAYCLMCQTMLRYKFNGEQFYCTCCGNETDYDKEFIDIYKKKWGIHENIFNKD